MLDPPDSSCATPDNPHRRELLIPSKDDIKPPSREDLLAWHKKVIGRNNVIVAVAGNVPRGRCRRIHRSRLRSSA